MNTPYHHAVLCTACGAKLRTVAEREDVARTRTRFNVKCPNCSVLIEVEVPLAIKASTVQITTYERPSS
jgi:transcription elongation factor Elf1